MESHRNEMPENLVPLYCIVVGGFTLFVFIANTLL